MIMVDILIVVAIVSMIYLLTHLTIDTQKKEQKLAKKRAKKPQQQKVKKRRIWVLDGQELEKRRAGELGEQEVAFIIEELLDEDDVLLRNIEVVYENKEAELDNVIISKRGVFIIEVKNYRGELMGDEEDYDWQKRKETQGNVYVKTVHNPIKQVKRQVYILAKYLQYYGIDVWVEGYVYFLNGNSPIDNEYILNDSKELENVLLRNTKNHLSKATLKKITKLLQS